MNTKQDTIACNAGKSTAALRRHDRKCERMVYLMDLEETICYCMSVTSGMIRDAVYSGADTLEEVQGITSAGTVCGSCLENVKRLVDQFVSERDGQ